MGKEIVYCDVCGERILEAEFDKGVATVVENKRYCDRCRQAAGLPATPAPPATAHKSSGLHPALRHEAPPPRSGATGARLKSVKAEVPGQETPRRATAVTARKTQTGRVPQVGTARSRPKGGSNTMLIVVGLIGAILLLILIIMVVSRGSGSRTGRIDRDGGYFARHSTTAAESTG